MGRANSLEKPLMLGMIEGKRRGQQRMRCWTASMDMNLGKLKDGEEQGSLVCCSPWGHRVRRDLATEQQQSPLSNQP